MASSSRGIEANFDGLVGPTHSYAGLSPGNVASQANRGEVSRPRDAARQGLAKMRLLAAWGIPQHVLPPQERPNVGFLRALGFAGPDTAVVEAAGREAPHLLAAACSASSMWAANAATVSPSADTRDGRVHLTPANLIANAHRAIEAPFTTRLLRAVFADRRRFVVHDPLPASWAFADEGAANHTRLLEARGEGPGVELFVYGRSGFGDDQDPPRRSPARQTEAASRAIARSHGLDPARVVFAKQSPGAIDAGVFHNDVAGVGCREVYLTHERALAEDRAALDRLREAAPWVLTVVVPQAELPIEEAVSTYLFNSQLLDRPGEAGLTLLAPAECQRSEPAGQVIERITADASNPIGRAAYVDVRESMRNGGGPACLRLRVTLTNDDRAALAGRTALDERLAAELEDWIDRRYREELRPADLADPVLLAESRDALDELTRMLGLPDLYDFQR